MITRVLDSQGQEIHNCETANCAVSWDGVDRASGEPTENAEGATPAYVAVDDHTVRLLSREELTET